MYSGGKKNNKNSGNFNFPSLSLLFSLNISTISL